MRFGNREYYELLQSMMECSVKCLSDASSNLSREVAITNKASAESSFNISVEHSSPTCCQCLRRYLIVAI